MARSPHSPAFRTGLNSIIRGERLIAPIRAYLMDPEFPSFDVRVEGLGHREPDFHFHPSEHPGWPERALFLWMTQPEMLVRELQEPTAVLSMTAGSIWHSIIGFVVMELGLVDALEVPVSDPLRRTRGKMDGVTHSVKEIFELKGLALDTPLPTPTGWTTMRDVSVGDEVIGSDGRPCRVMETSSVSWNDCFRLEFDDGTSIVADADHQWVTHSGQAGRIVEGIHTTAEIAATLKVTGRQANHRIMNASPLDLDAVDLPLDPYVLGVWIGDGSKHNGAVTQLNDSAVWGCLEDAGCHLGGVWGNRERSRSGTRTVYGLRTTLIEMDLLNREKSIPSAYLRSSAKQRLALLQGLMDTDGTWSPLRNSAVFTTVLPDLAWQVRQLVLSLGMRCRIQEVTARGFGVETQVFHVVFTPHSVNPFRARGHLCFDHLSAPPVRSTRRSISNVVPVGVMQTRCILVDSPDHTYLCGDQMVPTHNSMKDARIRNIQSVGDYLALYPTYHLQANEYMRMYGYHSERVLLMSLTFPYEMREFVIEYDHALGKGIAAKYERVLQAVADDRIPMCDGCWKSNTCPARGFCSSEMARA